MKRILFSCVGTTDPVRGGHDGGMLHIMRHYRPEAVCLYITPEMARHEKRDDRYQRTFAYVREHWDGYDPMLLREYGDVEDASDLDALAGPMTDIMRRLRDEVGDEETEILVNLSSGTPQMQMVLAQLAQDLQYRARGVQVKNFERKAGSTERTNKNDYWVEGELACNEDEQPGAPNRCVEPQMLFLARQRQRQRIDALLDQHDYAAADTLSRELPPEAAAMVRHLKLRSELRDEEARKAAGGLKLPFKLYPAKPGAPARSDYRAVSEFFLVLKNLQAARRYTELAVRLNPFVICLQKQLLRARLPFFDSLVDKKNNFYPNRLKKQDPALAQRLDGEMGSEVKQGPLSIKLLNRLLRLAGGQPEDESGLLERCERLNKAQRNDAAHALHAVTDDDIRGACGYTSARLLRELQALLERAYPECAPSLFDVYEQCEAYIRKRL